MKVLVCGGTGWVGHTIVEALLEKGHKATILCRGTPGRFPVPEGADLIKADKSELESFRKAVEGMEFDVVVDSVPTKESVENCAEIFSGKIRQYIHCSSTGVYAPLDRIPADEDHPWINKNPWFQGKRDLDILALEKFEKSGFPVTIVRPSNIIGAGKIPLDIWGARSPGYWRRLKEGKPITVPNHGDALLQPCHVRDVAEVHALAAGRDQAIGRTYIASAAYSITLNQYVEVSRKFLGSRSPVIHMDAEKLIARFEGTGKLDAIGMRFLCLHMCFDISRALRELGYEPRYTPEQGLEDSLDWMTRESLLS